MANKKQVEQIFRHVNATVTRKRGAKQFDVALGSLSFTLSAVAVDEYLSLRARQREWTNHVIFADGHFEHRVETHDGFSRRVGFYHQTERPFRMVNQSGELEVSVGPPSAAFLLALVERDESNRDRVVDRLLRRGRMERRLDIPATFAEAFRTSYRTVLVTGTSSTHHLTTSDYTEIAESVLFNIAYSTGLSLGLASERERRPFRLSRMRRESSAFPTLTYQRDLVAYYTLALGSDSALLAYLALYKILEYFFTSASEAMLHSRLEKTLTAPTFSPHKANKLRDLSKVIRRFDQKTNEGAMLKGVVRQFFSPDELSEFFDNLPEADRSYFCSDQAVFKRRFMVNPADMEGISANIADRIYHVRNALVHHKEGLDARFRPFTEDEEMLSREVRLVKFLAENIIVRSGKAKEW